MRPIDRRLRGVCGELGGDDRRLVGAGHCSSKRIAVHACACVRSPALWGMLSPRHGCLRQNQERSSRSAKLTNFLPTHPLNPRLRVKSIRSFVVVLQAFGDRFGIEIRCADTAKVPIESIHGRLRERAVERRDALERECLGCWDRA